MGKFKLKIEELAAKHLEKHFKSGNKANIKKIEKIFVELTKTPYIGIGSPEPLKYDLSGFWSRRINQKDRLIYKVEETTVVILIISAMGHYGDK